MLDGPDRASHRAPAGRRPGFPYENPTDRPRDRPHRNPRRQRDGQSIPEPGIVILGHIDSGTDAFKTYDGTFDVTIEAIEAIEAI
ncbi:hypothetical protein [Streptomyces sviceus]|uniref:hypothetical protein n=1 Tax=Streptomyces sviceus TaxID=285530 RepID=UPI0036E09743